MTTVIAKSTSTKMEPTLGALPFVASPVLRVKSASSVPCMSFESIGITDFYILLVAFFFWQTGDNPNNGTLSFDNFFSSAFQVLVIASNNGWSGTMYNMMDAEMFFSCLFFIFGLIVMNYWLINMFVAVSKCTSPSSG